ncbi:tRNA (N(6)-L-threonylcarbamoyladenosine(37)-C(2))-methylthiotransferase [Methanomethylophilus alvi]|uniref:tRNA (N(6)-L-threonylcarbamoyladenosine(37)-C(2))- methylthiotransferase n=1 Tax=Methanomethylophilus alvi TaxID=1291540 RepID=UPI0037DD7C43
MRYFVESYGCTMNYGEGEELAERMDALGHIRVLSADEADIVILNTCTVVDTTEKRMIKRMNELKAAGKQVIVTGCMAKVQAGRVMVRLPGSLIIPPEDYDGFSDAVSKMYGCGTPIVQKRSPVTAIIPIAQGCRGNCTYCITRFARGTLRSYSPEEIKERFDRFIDSGVKEVLITAQDTGCYGRDIGTDLGDLIRKLLEKDGEYRIRIGMMNPNSLRPVLNSVLDVFEDERIYRFLHIPVQSGSDHVLDMMSRHYTSEDFFSLIDDIRERYPDMSIATDLISGFPGENNEDHEESVALIRRLRADTVNITRFSPRPGTEAFGMPQINGRISKERSTELTEVKNATENDVNKNMIGRTYRALVSETSADGSVIARTGNYRPVVIKEDIPLGTFIDATVTDCRPTYLLGKST